MAGERRSTVTMEHVAARAGVSRALVSIVFRGVPGASETTRARVLAAADALGYRPDHRARLLGSARSRTLGVVYGLHRDFQADVLEALYVAADGKGYDLALGATAPSRDEHRAVRSLLEFRCEAIVLIGPTMRRGALEELAAQVPLVVVARSLRSRAVDVVRTDDRAGARLAVEHLAGLGHERIAHVDGQRAPGAAERRRGYTEAMEQLGLGRLAALVPGGLGEEDGARAATEMVRRRSWSAVTAFNDACATGMLSALRVREVEVPRDVSIVGYDDSSVAKLPGVALTTVAQDATQIAGSALDVALARIEEPDRPAKEVVVPPHLVVRGTTARNT